MASLFGAGLLVVLVVRVVLVGAFCGGEVLVVAGLVPKGLVFCHSHVVWALVFVAWRGVPRWSG